jgi:hypothetical protein
MPVLAAQVGRVPQVLRPTTRGRRERTDVRVSEIDEQGGELLEMARAGRVVWRRPPTRIAGRVIRAGTDQPVRGVGLTAVGATAPSFDSLITKACGAAAARAENDAHLLGHLTLPSPGAAGARLSVELQSADTSRSTARVDLDSRGNFRICNITAAMPVRLHVTAGGLRADTVMSLAAGVHSMSWQPSLVSIDRYATHAIRGVVVDSARHPIQGARVTVGAKELASTGEQGRFRIDVPSEADVVLELRRLGYAPVQQLVEREVDTTLVLTMLPAVQQLAGVEVTDRQIPGRLLGFEQRLAARGHATTAQFFITADEIDKRRPDLTSSLFSDIAGMRVLRVNLNEYGIFGLYHGGPCPAAVYIDGQRMPGSNIDTTILPSDIAGIEVYPRANGAPAAYQNLNGGCAVVLIWRKGG